MVELSLGWAIARVKKNLKLYSALSSLKTLTNLPYKTNLTKINHHTKTLTNLQLCHLSFIIIIIKKHFLHKINLSFFL
jgi:hypothetical protein